SPLLISLPCVLRSARRPFLFHRPRDRRDLHSFPTRRSSDLGDLQGAGQAVTEGALEVVLQGGGQLGVQVRRRAEVLRGQDGRGRSEEHTSELQSRFDLVCRLLLEKKNVIRVNLDYASGQEIT